MCPRTVQKTGTLPGACFFLGELLATLRLSDAEKAIVAAKAAAAGVSEKQWVKEALRDYLKHRQGDNAQ